jgi:hypothetical protein
MSLSKEAFGNKLIITMNKKVSCLCTTYRRFTCVERIISQFMAQTYQNKELIIFNTDVENPMSLGFSDDRIIIINNDKNYMTSESYKNRGEICRDATTHCTGDYWMLWDDDDIYLPWHLQQAVDGIESNQLDAWKPQMSFFATKERIILVQNTLEASVIVKLERIKEIGFRQDLTGYEGLSWYTKLRDEGQLKEINPDYIPSYCFNWSDPAEIAGHKQSGDINNPDNFENHKLASVDIATRPLEMRTEVPDYDKYYDFIKGNMVIFNQEYLDKYVKKYL